MNEQETEHSELPETVKVMKKLEAPAKQEVVTPALEAITPVQPSSSNTPKIIADIKNFFADTDKRVQIVLKVLLVIAIIVVLLVGGLFFLMITALDTTIFKLTLSGTIVSEENKPIANATVVLDDDQTVTTGADGRFAFSGLDIAKYKLTITADSYEDYEQEIGVTRSFLNYTTDRTYTLQLAGIGSLAGKLISSQGEYNFQDEQILLNGTVHKIEADGTFNLTSLKTGDVTFVFASANFVDIEREFRLDAGKNTLADITLTPAGDISGELKSWLRNDIVTDVSITAEGIDPEAVEIDQNGIFTIKDLEVNKEYKIRTEHALYETRDYTITVVQGENELLDFRLVEKGKVPYLAKVGYDLLLRAADFDGADMVPLTTTDLEVYAEYIDGENVYFLSTRDSVSSSLGGDALLVYITNTTGGNPQRLTTNVQGIGRVIPNFRARKLVNVRKGTETKHRVLEVMDLTGENKVEIRYINEGTFDDVLLSDNGRYIYYYAQDEAETLNGLYRADVQTGQNTLLVNKPNTQIYAVSSSGNRVLYTATNERTGLVDLFMYTANTASDTTVRSAVTGSQYQFVAGSENTLIYHDYQEGGNNLYKLELESNSATKLSKFSGVEGVEAIYQQAGYVFYQTNIGLYVLDITKPIAGKLVTQDVARYTGYDF